LNGYTKANRDNFGVVIYNLDLIIYSVKKNLSEIMPGEYKFSKIGKFTRVEPTSTRNDKVD
jgi:methyl coenzyme M reductase subunit D